jgi:hypothetical protein
MIFQVLAQFTDHNDPDGVLWVFCRRLGTLANSPRLIEVVSRSDLFIAIFFFLQSERIQRNAVRYTYSGQ